MTTEHLSVAIARPADAVYAYTSDPAHLPSWAAGLTDTSLAYRDGHWVTDGQVIIDFAPQNPYGVLDHDVTDPSGQTVHVPMRVIPDGEHSEVVFSLRRPPEMTDEEYARDRAAVVADLETLRDLLESRTR